MVDIIENGGSCGGGLGTEWNLMNVFACVSYH